jgi:hypothetical protein
MKEEGSLADKEITMRLAKQAQINRSVAQRLVDAKTVYEATGDRRAAIRTYCRGNRWLEENAKSVDNW